MQPPVTVVPSSGRLTSGFKPKASECISIDSHLSKTAKGGAARRVCGLRISQSRLDEHRGVVENACGVQSS